MSGFKEAVRRVLGRKNEANMTVPSQAVLIKPIKLPRPGSMPETVGHYLVTNLKLDPAMVWELKCAVRPHPNDKRAFDFRVFSEVRRAASGIEIKNYSYLDECPDLVLYQGWFDKRTHEVQIEGKS